MTSEVVLKNAVQDFWNRGSCGEVYASGASEEACYEAQRRARYSLEPYIFRFARFHEGRGKDVLEIGVGMGADHVEWAKSAPRYLAGIDLTQRAIEHSAKRLGLYKLESDLRTADAECLPFKESSFDLVYSWGVLHHTPNTTQAVSEVLRVLRPGGTARIMIYHKYSLIAYMLWLRYALLKGRIFKSLASIYSNHLESPGTKAYSLREARRLFKGFATIKFDIELSSGDLLEGAAGQRHRGPLLSVARLLWPRRLLRVLFKNHGLFLLVEATKSHATRHPN